jgi:hypothetical protein
MGHLNELAKKYNTDKSDLFHNYCDEYEFFLEKLRYNNIKLLEIGVSTGNSINMWLEYFPNASIFGIDISNCGFSIKTDRFIFRQGNQSVVETYDGINNLNIIIDDGSHITEDQMLTFEILFPRLNSNGVYIIEDVSTSYWEEYGFEKLSFIDYTKKFIDEINYNGLYNEVSVKYQGGSLRHARSSVYLDETMKINGLSKKFDIRSIYYGNSFIIVFKK